MELTTETAARHRAAGHTTAPIRVQAHRVQEAAAQATAIAVRARPQEAEAVHSLVEAARQEALTTLAAVAVHAAVAEAAVEAAHEVEDADKPIKFLL